MDILIDVIIGVFLIFCAIGLIGWWTTNLSEREKWDLAANSLHFEGWSENEIERELGPRP